MKKKDLRSDCPINFALELFGDKWTLLVIRDLIFEEKQFYKDFSKSKERIATNILSDRLKRLEEHGIIISSVYEKQKTQKIYKLTPKGIDLIPVLVELIIWSSKHKTGLDVNPEFLKKLDFNKEEVLKAIRNKINC